MSREEADAMFQPFRGAFAKGSGLGLAIVHRIVSDHDGEVRVSSVAGQGTVVRVFLPPRQLPEGGVEPAPSDVTETPDLISGHGS